MVSQIYLRDTCENHFLTTTEKDYLILKAQNGCRISKDIMVETHVKMVENIARRFVNSRNSLDDLFQIGAIGLMKAIENFEVGQPVKFTTYAINVIVSQIKYYNQNSHLLKVSRTVYKNSQKINDFSVLFEQTYQREPTFNDYLNGLDINKEELIKALTFRENILTSSNSASQIDERLNEISNANGDWIDEWINAEYLKRKLDYLNDIEKKIILLRYYGEKTQDEVSMQLGFSQSKVYRLERVALKKLRDII